MTYALQGVTRLPFPLSVMKPSPSVSTYLRNAFIPIHGALICPRTDKYLLRVISGSLSRCRHDVQKVNTFIVSSRRATKGKMILDGRDTLRNRGWLASGVDARDVSRFLLARPGAEQSTDRRWTVVITCCMQRGPRTEHFCSHCPFVVLESLLYYETPSSVLTHVVQAHAHVPQDPSLLTFLRSRWLALKG